ncbi:hypothetical protein AB0I35_03130 [Nocardia sp. NPDC050378]|uniref:hypothetical protein n=1 Tax=Nocardia sp. NPDC050378 TaxID=3155400 RepID=UPI003411475B
MSTRTTRVIAGAAAAAALSLAAPIGAAHAATPVAGSTDIGCTSTDINPCPIRPLLDLLTLVTSGSA